MYFFRIVTLIYGDDSSAAKTSSKYVTTLSNGLKNCTLTNIRWKYMGKSKKWKMNNIFNLQSQRGKRQFCVCPRGRQSVGQTSNSIHYNRGPFISFIKKTKRNETKRSRTAGECICICICRCICICIGERRLANSPCGEMFSQKSWNWDIFMWARNLHVSVPIWNMPFIYFVFYRYYAP